MTYEEAITQTPVALVEFYATWCPHCKRMKPVMDQVKELLGSQVAVTQLDIDENREAADAAEVDSLPTFIVYKHGREVWRHSGEIDGNDLLAKVQSC